ncbi:hypothetical protein KY330_03750 [Candidatus Woesearchaeota archaeon]|nr:hypothetical protein [Candidatus Woesearchaeota archaeon]
MVTMPSSMEDLIYFTNRKLGDGNIKVWVYKQKCPKCGKGLMGKPVDEKTGKVKIRAKDYVCSKCGHTVEKKEYEETLSAEAVYLCPNCKKKGESVVSYKRKSIGGVQTLRVPCQHCGYNIDVTKKMKEKKK